MTLPKTVSGTVGCEIALSITASLVDTDGSETLTLKLSGLPATATLNHGLKLANGTWRLTPTDLLGLKLQASTRGTVTLKVDCLSTESLGGIAASVSANMRVQIA